MAKTKSSKKTQGPAFIDRGEQLPRSYGINRMVAMVRDPEHIFIYWDIEGEIRVMGSPLVIRVTCVSEDQSWDIEPNAQTDNWYFNVTSNRTYKFDLFARRQGKMELLASSREVTTPVRRAGESGGIAPEEIILAERYPLARGKKHPIRTIPEVPAEIPKALPSAAPKPAAMPPPRVSGFQYVRGKE